MFMRGLACLEPCLSVLDFVHSELPLLLQHFAWVGSLPSIFRHACLGALPLALDFVNLGFSSPLQGVSCMGPTLPAPDHVHLGFLPSARGSSCSGSALFVLDFVHLDFSPFLHGVACPEPVSLALDLTHLGSLLLPRGAA